MASFEVDGVTYELIPLEQLDDLTLGEIEALEKAAGAPLSELLGADGISISIVIGLAHVSMLRVNPAATIEQARSIKASVLFSALGLVPVDGKDDADPPTPLAADGAPDSESDSA